MKKSTDVKIFNGISYTLITVVALLCLIPFLLVVAGSFTDEKDNYCKWIFTFSKEFFP